MAELKLYFLNKPGYLSFIYFVFLELFGIALYDYIFRNLAQIAYVRRIKKGFPIKAQHCNIIGISDYLVGGYLTTINVIITVFKISLLVIIFYIEYAISDGIDQRTSTSYLTANYYFNETGARWDRQNRDPRTLVLIPFQQVRDCYTYDAENFTIDFYRTAFNLTDDMSEQQLFDQYKDVNFSDVSSFNNITTIRNETLQCLSPEFVNKSSSEMNAKVEGCSQIFNISNCFDGSLVAVNVPNDVNISELSSVPSVIPEDDFNVTVDIISDFSEQFAMMDQRYDGSRVWCMRKGSSTRNEQKILFSFACIVQLYNSTSGHTLLERWTHDEETNTFIREFPGPLFKGQLQLAGEQAVYLLAYYGSWNWLSFSTFFVAQATSYIGAQSNVEKIIGQDRYVSVTTDSLILLLAFCVVGVVTSFVVGRSVRQSTFPQINSLDGLSSVMREESEPTGRSLEKGKPVVLGLTQRDRTVHFGPIRTMERSVSRIQDIDFA